MIATFCDVLKKYFVTFYEFFTLGAVINFCICIHSLDIRTDSGAGEGLEIPG